MAIWTRRRCCVIKGLTVCFFWSLLVFIAVQFKMITIPRYSFRLVDDERLLVDKGQVLTDDQIIGDLQRDNPNFPIVFWHEHKDKSMQVNKTCAKFPNLFEMEFNNQHWQTLQTSDGIFQLYGAYLDVRRENRMGPSIRILGMINRVDPTVTTHCHIWYDGDKEPVIVKSAEYKLIWNKKWGNNKTGIYQPYLIACVLPKSHVDIVPDAVSLVEKPCDTSTNNLRVIYNKADKKKDFAVCVKGLDYLHVDLSVRLVEWIELVHILGADKVFMYELEVHPNISKVLKYFEQQGKVQVTPISLAGAQPNAPFFQHMYLKKKLINKRQNELIPYNDCFYKHMYEYKYIVLLDIDEVIVPTGSKSWKDLLETVVPKSLKAKNKERASYNVRNVYFLDDMLHDHGWFDGIPKYMHMLQHVYRAKNFTKPGQYIKCFHNTELVLTLHNHYPFSCLAGSCLTYSIETSDAQLQHYRADCVNELKKSCSSMRENSVLDTTIWEFKGPLIERVTDTLRTLGFLTRTNSDLTS